MRYALLAYGRNDAKGLVYHALRNLGGTVTFQADFLFKIGNLEQLFQHSTHSFCDVFPKRMILLQYNFT